MCPQEAKGKRMKPCFAQNISDSEISIDDSVPKNILAFHMDISPRVKESIKAASKVIASQAANRDDANGPITSSDLHDPLD